MNSLSVTRASRCRVVNLAVKKLKRYADAGFQIRIACSQIFVLLPQVLWIAKFLNHHRPAMMQPHLGKNPPQRLTAAKARFDEMEKRIRPLDGDDFERLTGSKFWRNDSRGGHPLAK